MPPPPPPSKSYLLVLDTSSSEEEDNDHDNGSMHAARIQQPSAVVLDEKKETDKNEIENSEDEKDAETKGMTSTREDEQDVKNEIENSEDEKDAERKDDSTIIVDKQDENNHEESATKKKKKKRKKKRNKKKTLKKSVSFGSVSVRQHGRCLGTDVVPLDGGWPLGISNEIEQEDTHQLSDFEQERQEVLQQRWKETFQDEPCKHNVLETRQYDFKKKIPGEDKSHKNPLFGMMKEESRMKLLLRESSSDVLEENHKQLLSSSPKRNHGMKTRSRSVSNADKYEYNDVYTCTEVKHVRNELEQIRNNRGLEHAGCTCRHKKDYNARSHKRHHHRMTERKLKEELRKRGLLPKSPCGKAELESILKEATSNEPCCWGEDCPCVRSGIGCHADSCTCWQSSSGGSATSVWDIQQECGNRYGMYVTDTSEIKAARQVHCQEVSTKTATTQE